MKKRPHTCAVCEEEREEACFPSSQIHNHQTGHNSQLRCTACHTCVQCRTERQPEEFNLKATICKDCIMKKRPHTCAVCVEERKECEFDDNNLMNATKRGGTLVCLRCQDVGFTPKHTDVYHCTLCGPNKPQGRGNFSADRQYLQKWRAAEKHEKPLLLCNGCEKTHER